MSCILRAFGSDFDIDAFINSASLIADSTWLKGEKRFPNSDRNQSINDSSGIRIVASKADFTELAKQIEESTLFLRQNHDEIKKLTSISGVEGAFLDFGINIYPPGWSTFTFPPELLILAGSAGVSLCVSVYPTDEESDTDA